MKGIGLGRSQHLVDETRHSGNICPQVGNGITGHRIKPGCQDRERRPQGVGRLCVEGPLMLKGLLQARERIVDGLNQWPHLVRQPSQVPSQAQCP